MNNFPGGGATEEGGQVILRAIDPKTGERAWEYPMTGFGRMWTGTVSTKTGVLFSGDDAGQLIALEARTGRHLWNFNMGELSTASPVIYEVDGNPERRHRLRHRYLRLRSLRTRRADGLAQDQDPQIETVWAMASLAWNSPIRLAGLSICTYGFLAAMRTALAPGWAGETGLAFRPHCTATSRTFVRRELPAGPSTRRVTTYSPACP